MIVETLIDHSDELLVICAVGYELRCLIRGVELETDEAPRREPATFEQTLPPLYHEV